MEKLRKNTCRKAISFFVTGLLTIACLPANVSVFSAAWNGTVDTSWYQAGETQLSISNPEELAGLAKLVNDGTTNFEGVTITLEADLQMNPLTNWEKWETAEAQPSNTWVPIGLSINPCFMEHLTAMDIQFRAYMLKKAGKQACLPDFIEQQR